MKIRYLALSLLIIFSLTGCEESGRSGSVVREDLFSLNIGVLEDQIAIFNIQSGRNLSPVDITMRNGFYYFSDSNGGKITRYNSYGDILFMIYNEETNPPPMTLRPFIEGNLLTRWAVHHPLLEPGYIAVDSRNHIFVQDSLPFERHGFDTESSSLLNNTVIHFDATGRFLGNIGREGVGGTPFPRIEGLYSSIRDELAVVCRLTNGWNVYWFDSEGNLLFLVPLLNDAIPIPFGGDGLIPSLDTIAVSPDSRRIFVKVDYYGHIVDESTNTRMGIEPSRTIMWVMNAEYGFWENQIDVPFYEYTYTEQNRRLTARMIYSLMGIINNERMFFSFPVDGGYSILVLSSDTDGSVSHHQGFIQVDLDEQQFNVFDLSNDGILSGLLVSEWQAKLVWWRTDRLLSEGS